MTAHALAGLGALNVLFLLSGVALLWLVRGWEDRAEILRLGGLAHVVGVVTTGTLWTLLLIVGVPFGLWLVLGTPICLTVVCLAFVRRRRREATLRDTTGTRRGLLVAAFGIAATGLLLEGMFRVSRLSGLYWWDAWSFWVPKAKAIYFYGGLDGQFFTELPGPSYPPLVPILDAAAFHAMGSADTVTLHVQYWLFGLGFVWALAGVLARRVPPWILWPFVLLLLVAPRLGRRFHVAEADLLLDFFFVLAATLVALWLLDRARWRLVVASLLLCGMVLTKREGLLLAALLVAAALLATVREWRSAWPRIAFAGVVAAAVAIPWRIWYLTHDLPGEAPEGGGLNPTESTERLWPALRLAFDVLFSSDYWSVLVLVVVGALVLAAFARAFMLVAFFGALIVFVTLGGGWITWAIPELPITQELSGNPIVRYMGAAALLSASASPVLLAATWSRVSARREVDTT